MIVNISFAAHESVRNSNLSYRAWFQADEHTRNLIQSAYEQLCDSVIRSPGLVQGSHPKYADIMRCAITNAQDLLSVKQGDPLPKPIRTISPDVVIIVRKTPAAYQMLLRRQKHIDGPKPRVLTQDVVIREKLRPLKIMRSHTEVVKQDRFGFGSIRILLSRIFNGY